MAALLAQQGIGRGSRVGLLIVFDVPSELVTGGQIQLITGRMINALWQVK